MATLADIKTRFSSLNVTEVVSTTLEQSRYDLIEQQQDQMLHGVDSKGHIMGKYKNPSYARKKFSMNRLAGFGNYDLRLKGPFQNNITIKFFSNSLVFYSTDSKTEKIVDITSIYIFGLNEYRIGKLTEDLLNKRYTENIKRHLYAL